MRGEAPPRARLATKEAEAAARGAEGAVEGAVAHLPHVKNWLRTKHAVLFRLSNRTIQVCFQDGSEVLLSSEASACVFHEQERRANVPLPRRAAAGSGAAQEAEVREGGAAPAGEPRVR